MTIHSSSSLAIDRFLITTKIPIPASRGNSFPFKPFLRAKSSAASLVHPFELPPNRYSGRTYASLLPSRWDRARLPEARKMSHSIDFCGAPRTKECTRPRIATVWTKSTGCSGTLSPPPPTANGTIVGLKKESRWRASRIEYSELRIPLYSMNTVIGYLLFLIRGTHYLSHFLVLLTKGVHTVSSYATVSGVLDVQSIECSISSSVK